MLSRRIKELEQQKILLEKKIESLKSQLPKDLALTCSRSNDRLLIEEPDADGEAWICMTFCGNDYDIYLGLEQLKQLHNFITECLDKE